MTVSAAALRKLALLKLSSEQMAGVLDILADGAEAEEARKTAQRERTRRHREKRDGNVTVTSQERDNLSPKKAVSPTPPLEKTTPIPEPNGSSGSVTRATDLAEFKAELHDLDAPHLDAIVKHRRSKRGQLTGLAARLFRRDAEACGLSIADAVDTCISRNWITVQPEYLNGRQRTAQAPPRERSVSDALGEMAAGTWTGPKETSNEPFLETSFTRRN